MTRSMLGKVDNATNLRCYCGEKFQPNSPGIKEFEDYVTKNVTDCFGKQKPLILKKKNLKAFQLIFNTMEICARGNNRVKKTPQDLEGSTNLSNDENQNLENNHTVDVEAAEKLKAQIREEYGLTCVGDDEEEEDDDDDQQNNDNV